MNIFRKKTVTANTNTSLNRVLGAFDLTMLGVGAIVGTGIFVLTGVAAAKYAGPALILSFIIAGLACTFAALCYSEFASMIPQSGSAYTYSYVAFGEVIAWILGWDLVLEYGLASAAVASGWSGYFQSLLSGFGIHLPTFMTSAFNPANGTFVDVPAIIIVFIITLLLSRGIQESSKWNIIMVFIKLAVVLLFIFVGVWYIKPDNWVPFTPYGFSGVTTGAAVVVFAYFGFDAVSTAAEEVKNPQRNLPIGIISALTICTVLYIIVSLILTGIVPYDQLNVKDPVAFALSFINQNWVAGFVSLGAIIGITTVLMVMMFGQTRLFYAISRDGLLPKSMQKVSKKTQVPIVSTWITSALVAIFAGFVPLDRLAELTNIGTLFAFTMVSLGVVVLRYTQPDLQRGFKTPFVPFIPALAVIFCVYLMLQLSSFTWKGFVIWLAIGLIIYIAYGYKHSKLNDSSEKSIH
ncbi:amino acid permease [Cytobacillus oceanisediminis]|jgi:APA family basic amino acid/polyamine antiporter|uniref:Amino acid permease n=1 Tax=Niallia circulans TaxID=1397 RepID=A0A941G9V4_NIACI|nr:MULTISPECIES: amino acid permease [Bacillaceae]MBZ9536434.1 amino acid permease [Cytobacillus oceanisediminis]MCB5236050.1 amino acid permease [Niallia circulans]MED3791827.1 amino acid permease [Niallia alba]